MIIHGLNSKKIRNHAIILAKHYDHPYQIEISKQIVNWINYSSFIQEINVYDSQGVRQAQFILKLFKTWIFVDIMYLSIKLHPLI